MTDDGLRWLHERFANPPPEPRWLVRGLAREGELLVAAAPRGTGKSFLVYNLAVRLALGDGALFGHLPVARKARTLILQGEMDEWAANQRWGALLGDERPEGVAETFEPVRLRVRQVQQTRAGPKGRRIESWYEADLDERVEQWIAEHRFDVLVIDPWATYFTGSENSNDEVEAGLSVLRALTLKYGVAVVIIHHFAKATDTRDPETLWRGASRLADWASTRITMLPHYSAAGAADAGLSPQEARRFIDLHFLRRNEPLNDFSVHLDEDGLFSYWAPGEGERSSGFVGRLTVADVARICWENNGFTSVADATRALGASGERARQALDRAVSDGVLVTEEHGRRRTFRLAPMGDHQCPICSADPPWRGSAGWGGGCNHRPETTS